MEVYNVLEAQRTKVEQENFVSTWDIYEKFYLHPIHFSIHPIREMGSKYGVCVIWGI